MKHIFIINPAAGKKGGAERFVPAIDDYCGREGLDYEIARTERPGHGAELTKVFLEKHGVADARFYACGGDGTLNEVANGAAGHDGAVISHIPLGSGNDFIKTFTGRPAEFLDIGGLVSGLPVECDMIKCGDKYAVNICSVGLDARVAARMPVYKKLPLINGSAAYNLSVIHNLMMGISRKLRVSVDSVCLDGDYTLLIAANGRFYGGGFNAMPDAMPGDGLLEFLLVKGVSRLRAASVVGAFKAGRYKEMPDIMRRISGKRMELVMDKPWPVNIDGEIVYKDSVTFELSDKKFKFLIPAAVYNTFTRRNGMPLEV